MTRTGLRDHKKTECSFCGRKVPNEHSVIGRGNNDRKYCNEECVIRESKECSHTGVDVEYHSDGLLSAECERCGFPLEAEEIDTDYLKDSGEIVVLKWRVVK
jgi:hypothetical protein